MNSLMPYSFETASLRVASSPRWMFVLILAAICILFAPYTVLASGGAGDGGHSVIHNIAVCLVLASAFGFVMKQLKQPPLLGYLAAGVLIGPVGFGIISDHTEIVTLSEIGLILLLFMIGLEIDLKKMLSAGKWVIVPGLLQFPICVGASFVAFWVLQNLGVDVGIGSYARLYCAIAVSLSSTMIVVKLLFDKLELDTLPGRITVGILVFQDLWAIIVLAIQPNMNNPEILSLAQTFGIGALLVGAALGVSRYILPFVFRSVAQVPELMLVISLGWCFLVALVASSDSVGLSMEMGALIAGVSLATFPYNLDVVAKAISIRDFFITLFFVALGMQIPLPSMSVAVSAVSIALVALAARGLGIFGVLYATWAGHRTAFLASINLSQVSEFSLVILAIGVELGHIDTDTLAFLTWVFAILAVTSTYAVTYSHPLQQVLSRLATSVGLKDLQPKKVEEEERKKYKIVLLGFFRIASALVAEIKQRFPHLLDEIKVVDFSPKAKETLEDMGVSYVYGDISHPDTLHHADIHDAELVLCTIPDTFLRGTSNAKIAKHLGSICPHAHIVGTAESVLQAKEIYNAGAHFVLEANQVAATSLIGMIGKSNKEIADLKTKATAALDGKRGYLS